MTKFTDAYMRHQASMRQHMANEIHTSITKDH